MPTKYLLDTNHISYYLKKQGNVGEKLKSITIEELSVSIISQAENYYGAFATSNPDHFINDWDNFVQNILLVNFSDKAARYYGQIKAFYTKEKRKFSEPDLMIAATALAYDLVLVTANLKDFEVCVGHFGLKVENWY